MAAPTPAENLAVYATVQRAADAEILRVLRDAYADSSRELTALATSGRGSGAAVRRDQIRAVQRSLLERQAEIFRRTGDIVERKRAEAAAKAIRVAGRYDEAAFAAVGREAEARALARGLEETELRTVDAAIARMTGSHTALSTRVYRTQVFADGMLERRINSGLARGLSAQALATELREFINPNTPGGTRYAALRLARTEINNAYHAISIQAARLKPWIDKMEWHKSGSHKIPDECDRLNGQLFKVDDVPRKPHPQCLCIVIPVIGGTPADDAAFLDALVGGEFDSFLNEFANQHNLPADAPVAPVIAIRPAKKAAGRAATGRRVNRIDGEPGQRVQEMLDLQQQLSPRAMQSLNSVSFGRVSSGENGHYDPGSRRITLSRNLSTNDRPIRDSTEVANSVTGVRYNTICGHSYSDLQCTLAHEYGHHIDRVVRELPEATQAIVRSISTAMGIPAPESFDIISVDSWIKANRRRIQKSVSKYAGTNVQELVAEIWAEYSTNPDARPHIKAIGKELQRLAESTR